MNRQKGVRILKQVGLSMIELLVAMAISAGVMGGVLQVLVASKSNFVTERELAALQENARFAIKFLSDEIRMAGYTGCSSTPLNFANSVNGSSGNWYLDGAGIQGFEYDAGIASFPAEFRGDVAADTDSIVIRRGEKSGLKISGGHNRNSANMPFNQIHDYKPGQVLMVASPNCQQIGIFQVSGPTNTNNNQSHIVHNTGGSSNPGNCTKDLAGNFDCSSSGDSVSAEYADGSSIMEMRSEAYYIGVSGADNTIPALFRERLVLNDATSTIFTTSEELVQGVENLQVLYGLDNSLSDGIADIYVKANDAAINWDNVVSVRLALRMKSLYPVYNNDETFPVFEGITGTNGSDRFMRQIITTTIAVRNG